jgi:hypothetical protein
MFRSIHRIIINRYPSYVQIHLLISRSIISNRFRSIHHIKATGSGHDIATCSVHSIAKYWKTTLAFDALHQQKNIYTDTHHCKEGKEGLFRLVVLAAAI